MKEFFLGMHSLQSPGSLEDKLKCAHDMGFSGVELLASQLEEMPVPQLKRLLSDLNLRCVSAHVSLQKMVPAMPVLAELGASCIVDPICMAATHPEAMRYAERLNMVGRQAAMFGLRVACHNSSTEFAVVEGKTLFESLIAGTDPSNVDFQLDCGWAASAGIWAPSLIRRYSGRFSSVHVKENCRVLGPVTLPRLRERNQAEIERKRQQLYDTYAEKAAEAQCPLGSPESNINWQEIRAALQEQPCGEAAWIVERDHACAGTLESCLQEDLRWLKANIA